MTDIEADADPQSPLDPEAEEEVEERGDRLLEAARLLDEDPLVPETAGDDTDEGWSEGDTGDRDSQIADDRPPHH